MMNKLAAALFALTTAGCAAESDGALHLTGRLADPSSVTHVIAANTETGERLVTDFKSDGMADGVFDVELPTRGSWVVTFANAEKTGEAMRIATLQTAGIDAFGSTSGGTINFGAVKVSDKRAHGTVDWAELTGATGMDQASLVKLGQVDDLALRFANPDVDNDGQLDALQGRLYRLDVEGQYRLQRDGRDLGIGDLIKGGGQISVNYLGTSLHAVVPNAMGMNMQSGTVTFDQAFFGTALGPQTPSVKAGTPIGFPHIKYGQLDGAQHIGVHANPDHAAPAGTYEFGFDNGQLSFSDIKTPSVERISAATDYSVPFVHIRTSRGGCASDCDIGGIDLRWMRSTSSGWVAAPAPLDARIDIVTQVNGKDVYLGADVINGATSLEWSAMPITGTGLLRSELAYISTSEICYFGVSYMSELGMKMTSQVRNPACN